MKSKEPWRNELRAIRSVMRGYLLIIKSKVVVLLGELKLLRELWVEHSNECKLREDGNKNEN